MIAIQDAVLHVFDFASGANYFSKETLDVDDKATKSYLTRRLKSIMDNPESRHGTFSETSDFAGGLGEYLRGQVDFVAFSQQIAQWFWEQLRKTEDLAPVDLLILDAVDTAKEADGEEEISRSGNLLGRYFAIMLLPRRQTFCHVVESRSNEIMRQDVNLPNPTAKISTYVLIHAADMSIDFHDKERSLGEATINLIDGMFLQCTSEASTREVVGETLEMVSELCDDFGLQAAVELPKTKAALARHAEISDSVAPLAAVTQVFEERPEVVKKFEERAADAALPEESPIKPSAAKRLTNKHRIVTDTGIEISYPSVMTERAGYIEFVPQDDGSTMIVIKGVGSIENK